MTEESGSGEERRQSMWSVPDGWAAEYFAAFSWVNLITSGLLTYDHILHSEGERFSELYVTLIGKLIPHSFFVAIYIFTAIEVAKSTMITANYLRQRFLEPLKERQRAEGLEEMEAAWLSWLNRKSEAEAGGIPFDEPPPTAESLKNR